MEELKQIMEIRKKMSKEILKTLENKKITKGKLSEITGKSRVTVDRALNESVNEILLSKMLEFCRSY